MPTRAAALASSMLLLVGCSSTGGAPSEAQDPSQPVAIATTTMLGSVLSDITRCAGTTSQTLLPVGVDPHDFSLSSAQVAQLVRAKLVVTNGLGLESGMASALENVQRDGGNVYEVGPDVDPLPLDDPSPEASQSGGLDPHFWMDASRMAKAAALIGEQLADATGEQRYTACGATVSADIAKVDSQIRDTLSAVPDNQRVLVTDHDAMGYFASAYKFRIAAVVVPGGSTDAEPSSADLANVVQVVRESGVHAIFSNTAVSPRLVQSVSDEAGGVVVVPLYVDSLGTPGSGADTYAGMMRTDAKRVADALA